MSKTGVPVGNPGLGSLCIILAGFLWMTQTGIRVTEAAGTSPSLFMGWGDGAVRVWGGDGTCGCSVIPLPTSHPQQLLLSQLPSLSTFSL